ncbi:unnamed protein product [Calypogeia fissa]
MTIWPILLTSALVAPLLFVFFAVIYTGQFRRRAQRVVAFFHPFTNDGGGGERVLWCAVRATQESVDFSVVIYTGDPATPESLTARAQEKFGIILRENPLVVQLEKRKWVEAATWPRFTLLGQSIGSMILGWEALTKLTPVLYIDTSGYAFTYPLARLFGCKVACYTHYPTISSDMLERVKSRKSLYNNDDRIAKSVVLSRGKVIYYRFVAYLYGRAGCCTHLAMVNGSWTRDHIEKLWRIPKKIVRVYPPCDTGALQELPLERIGVDPFIISVAQFRPEKAHDLQLSAFQLALETLQDRINSELPRPRLKLVGSCRNAEDEQRVENLKQMCFQLGIEEDVDFCVNVPYRILVNMLGNAVAGLHTMIDEHFGISVVEYMAAGAIPIANRSAGPKQDIVVDEGLQQTGFLAQTADEYAEAIIKVLTLPEEERLQMASAGRRRASRFSEARFDEDFKAAMRPLYRSLD